jgi:hypothetical protein
MKTPRVLLVLTVLNAVLLVALLSQQASIAIAEPTVKGDVAEIIRTHALEIVDHQNRVRGMIAIMPPSKVDGKQYPETVLLRLIDPKSGPVVKISAAENGAAMHLSDPADAGILVHAFDTGNFVRVSDKGGPDYTLTPAGNK